MGLARQGDRETRDFDVFGAERAAEEMEAGSWLGERDRKTWTGWD